MYTSIYQMLHTSKKLVNILEAVHIGIVYGF